MNSNQHKYNQRLYNEKEHMFLSQEVSQHKLTRQHDKNLQMNCVLNAPVFAMITSLSEIEVRHSTQQIYSLIIV